MPPIYVLERGEEDRGRGGRERESRGDRKEWRDYRRVITIHMWSPEGGGVGGKGFHMDCCTRGYSVSDRFQTENEMMSKEAK